MSRRGSKQQQRGNSQGKNRENVPTRQSRGGDGQVEDVRLDRELYKPPPGYDTKSMEKFREYIQRTEVEDTFKKLVKLLLSRPILPYNPYPGFVIRLRQFAEKFHMNQDSDEKIEYTLRNSLQGTYLPSLYRVKGTETVWGLSSILRVVNPEHLEKYKWLVEDLTPHPEELYSTGDYSNQVMVALVGPVVFEGTFYPHIHSIQIRMEHLITGPDIKTGVSIFVNSVMASIDAMYSNPRHLIIGVNMPIVDEEYTDITVFDFWDPDRIQQDKEEFLQTVSDAVIGNKYVYLECVFRVDPFYPKYMKGQIQFGLNFIEISLEDREEGLSSFCEFPMASLHEGVFLNRSHAEQYISLFTPQTDPFEGSEARPPIDQPSTSDNLVVGAPKAATRVPSRAASHYSSQSRNRRFSASQTADMSKVKRHIYDRMEHVQPRKVRIDGFRIADEQSYGPYAWQITTPLKAYYQKKIAGYHMHAELCESVYCAIILLLLDRDSYAAELPLELYRLLHGTVGRLHLLMEQNKGIRYILKGFSNTQEVDVVRENLALYREAITHLFESELMERSTEQVTSGRIVISQIEDFLPQDDGSFDSLIDLQMALKTLKNLNWYFLTLSIQLAEDCLAQCPLIKDVMIAMKNTFPGVIPQPLTRHRQRKDASGVEQDVDVQHGLEHEHMKDLLHENLAIDVEANTEKMTDAPRLIAKEGVLVKYMLDTHLDDVYHDFLLELATGEYFPPNPYPRLVSMLRQQAMRMDLCFEKKEAVLESLLSNQLVLEDRENFVYTLPGIDCYGTPSAIRMLDTGAFMPMSQILHMFLQKNYIQRKGTFRVGITLALSGPSILYGKAQPYLNEVEMHEHYYVQGPPGCSSDGLHLFSLLVLNSVVDMVMKNTIPVVGVYFGDLRWSWEEIINKRQGFQDTVFTFASRKEPIFLKAFILMDQWRYVPVRKYFLLHYLTDDEIDSEIFYPDNPVAFYQSVFLTKDRAAFHYQNGGPSHSGDPMVGQNVREAQQFLDHMIAVSKDRCDWMTVHRGLLLRSLISQDTKHVVESWRMLHSMAAQVEYIINMIDALQDLVLLTMESEEYEASIRAVPLRSVSQDSHTRGRGNKAGSKPPSRQLPPNVIPDFECTIDEAILGRMTMVFHKKLVEICQARMFMTGTPLADFLKAKLKIAIEEDPRLDNFYFAYNNETLFRLEEVKHMMKQVQDSLAADVHLICPIAQVAVDNLGIDHSQESRPWSMGRPGSVASNILNDPYMYRPRPQAQMMQTILE